MILKHTPTTLLTRALLVAAALILTLSMPSTSAAEGPVEGAAGGCALQCIEKALVTTTTTKAKVVIQTAVPAKVVVTARRLSSSGRIDGPVIKAVGPTLIRSRTLFLYSLQPERTYRIIVSATDAAEHTATQSGKFKTRHVQTTGLPGAGGLSSGLGCSAKCITKAVPVHIGPTAAMFDVATDAPARITVITSLAGTGSIVSIATSRTRTQSYRTTASPLHPGTRYDLRVRATDANGHTESHEFSFRTVERKAQVTFWKIQVIEDGDSVGQGELSFGYWLGGNEIQRDGYRKFSSGDVFDVRPSGSSRPGLTGILPANGAAPTLKIRVLGEDCDALLIRNCIGEVWYDETVWGGSDYYAVAGGTFALNALVTKAALPAGYGTMLPSGHYAYLVFETTQHGVKFRVFATLDFFYAW